MSDIETETTTTRERSYHKPTRGQRRNLIGIVTGTKMSKTLIVRTERVEQHRKYLKYIRRHSKIYVHDEKQVAKVGDTVRVVECRPLSKLKRFALVGVVTVGSSS
jgi:small subunit ribosomal protein S17